MSTTSAYWSTSEGQGIIYAIVAVGITIVLAIVLGIVGYWCYRKGKLSKLPQMFAARPVWALPPRVIPKPITVGENAEGDGVPAPGGPLQSSFRVPPAALGSGGIHIHHYDGGGSSPKPSRGKKKRPQVAKATAGLQNVISNGQFAVPQPVVSVDANDDDDENQQAVPVRGPKLTYPNYVPPISTPGAPFVKPFMPFSVDPHLTAPEDNILTDNLLRFATGSSKKVARNTNLKSVLILNKQRRKNVMDDITKPEDEQDWHESDEEVEERAANNFIAVGGDEIQVDARAGRIYVDEKDEIHVFADEKSNTLIPKKEIA